ncbi:hypothetical protein HK096_005219 [Nowakowskiella sp. JEL0078]|nr:hypothetical protein HK096_005219 [Nowakowskiella sp. JEL0078]
MSLKDSPTNELYLHFSPSNLAYSEVAAHLLAASTLVSAPAADLRLGITSLLASTNTLTIPAGIHNATKTVLTSKPAILRYFARAFPDINHLYAALSPANLALVDEIIELCENDNVGSVSKSVAGKKAFLVGEALSLADLVVWDFVVAKKVKAGDVFVDWLEAKFEVLKKAKALVDAEVAAIPAICLFRNEIVRQVATAVKAEPASILARLEVPRDSKNGDIALPVPRLGVIGNPIEIAKTITEKFVLNKYITKVSPAGPFVNFTINRNLLRDTVIPQILTLKSKYGCNSTGFGKRAVLDFSSPNIAKPFHAGHLRSTIIGNFITNILKANGWRTVSINYLGDWGKQYGLLAIGYEKYGNDKELEKDPIRHLFEVYVKINKDIGRKAETEVEEIETEESGNSVDDLARAYFKRMEDGDSQALQTWQKFRDLSIVKYKEIYKRVNVDFDIYSGESQYSASQMEDVVKELSDLGLLVEHNNARIVDLKEHKLGVAVIVRSDGAMLYLSRDIAAAIERQRTFKSDSLIYIVGNAQDHHFRQLFKILDLMGRPWARNCVHVGFGMIKSKDGEMSTRKGKVIFLEQILNDTRDAMHDVMKENENKYKQIQDPIGVADIVGISSIMVQDMSARRGKDYEFDWNRMLTFEGDTGPYLQYAHARLCSMERTANLDISDISTLDFSVLVEPSANDLLEKLSLYPDVLLESAQSYEPCTLVNYVLTLSHCISAAWENLWVVNQPEHIARARMALYRAARITLGNALSLLGLKPVERM